MLDILRSFGLDVSDVEKPETLYNLREKYLAGIASFNKAKADAKPTVLPAVERLMNDETLKAKAEAVRQSLTNIIGTALDDDENISFLLVEVLADLKATVVSECDYLKARKLNVKTGPVLPLDRGELKNLADLIRSIYRWQCNTFVYDAPGMQDTKDSKGKVTKPGKFPTFISATSGERAPSLPKLPKMPKTEAGTSGRHAKLNQQHYQWRENLLPPGLLLTDICHDYISDRKAGIIVVNKDVLALMKEQGQELSAKPGKRWEVKFPHGILQGWTPKRNKNGEEE